MHSVPVCPCLSETKCAHTHTFCMWLHCFDMLSHSDLQMKTASSSSWGGSPTSFLTRNTCSCMMWSWRLLLCQFHWQPTKTWYWTIWSDYTRPDNHWAWTEVTHTMTCSSISKDHLWVWLSFTFFWCYCWISTFVGMDLIDPYHDSSAKHWLSCNAYAVLCGGVIV